MRLEGEKGRRSVAVTVVSADPINYAIASDGVLTEGDRVLSRWIREE
jgi:hypothetical protein